jgi:hypothetical protein
MYVKAEVSAVMENASREVGRVWRRREDTLGFGASLIT